MHYVEMQKVMESQTFPELSAKGKEVRTILLCHLVHPDLGVRGDAEAEQSACLTNTQVRTSPARTYVRTYAHSHSFVRTTGARPIPKRVLKQK